MKCKCILTCLWYSQNQMKKKIHDEYNSMHKSTHTTANHNNNNSISHLNPPYNHSQDARVRTAVSNKRPNQNNLTFD